MTQGVGYRYGGFRGSMGRPVGILWDSHKFSVGMERVWGLKSNPHGTQHLLNHIISLLIPLFTFLCVVLFTTCVPFCSNYSLCMLIMFTLGLL